MRENRHGEYETIPFLECLPVILWVNLDGWVPTAFIWNTEVSGCSVLTLAIVDTECIDGIVVATNWKSVRSKLKQVARGRAIVQIGQADATPVLDSHPVFIVGVFRSGTTLLRYALDSHPSIAIPPESEFLVPLESVVSDTRSLPGLASLGYDREHVVARCRHFASYFFDNYARIKGKPRWGDKSPAYVGHLDWLVELFPNAQFVHIFRNPLDQIHSFTDGGRQPMVPLPDNFAGASEDIRVQTARWWRNQVSMQLNHMEAWPDQSLALSYEQLATQPNATLRRVLEFLGEPWDDRVLRFNENQHDFGMEDNKIRATKSFDFVTGGYETWPISTRHVCESITLGTYERSRSWCESRA